MRTLFGMNSLLLYAFDSDPDTWVRPTPLEELAMEAASKGNVKLCKILEKTGECRSFAFTRCVLKFVNE